MSVVLVDESPTLTEDSLLSKREWSTISKFSRLDRYQTIGRTIVHDRYAFALGDGWPPLDVFNLLESTHRWVSRTLDQV